MDHNVPIESKLYYENIDSRFNRNIDNSICTEIISELDGQIQQDSEFFSFCSRLTGALNEYGSLPPVLILSDYGCNYFNLWICDRISEILAKLDTDKSNHIKTRIKRFWDSSTLEEKCEPIFISYMNDSNYDKIKKLYEYALNYHHPKYYLDGGKRYCSEDNRRYIRESLILYKEVKQECQSESNENNLLCTALKNVRKIYTEDELSKLTCNGESLIEEHNVVAEEVSEKQVDGGPPRDITLQPDGSEREAINLRMSQLSNVSDSPTISDSHKSMTIAFPLLGIFSIFCILYKFTSARSWLHTRLLRKDTIEHNMYDDETIESLENTYDQENKNDQNGRHNIAYHPL
ncbi:PIR Superfamily Protein [Plasmodium ovale wallikeri]|uniref:PIR Superfamily Protein n=2 Tax=Plasmodium ovale TaxID=36330 RepID=A0A1A9AIT1_PLAOA|nr:PIR Superfamily Protein [Plasmodium ovale wallikeri]SBT57167.1 PIR Superfamily Protein [Plasmodium ovale wallikeri]SBT74049.1 Plasmodium vivax Vir protein, putative [Plasmodium ovale]